MGEEFAPNGDGCKVAQIAQLVPEIFARHNLLPNFGKQCGLKGFKVGPRNSYSEFKKI